MSSVTIQRGVDLQPFNSFRLTAKADKVVFFEHLEQWEDIRKLYLEHSPKVVVLGGGSNVLIKEDIPGLVIFNRLKGISIVSETEEEVILKVAAGENWHDLVMYTVARNWGGLENLALIPGSVGAAPMQNIGAYGVELKEVLKSVETLRWESGAYRIFSKEECHFAYRSSIFKTTAKGKYLITGIQIRLRKAPSKFEISYGALADTLEEMGVQTLSVQAISEAVMHIRRSKLPDPKVLGNAGSFFKNPEIPEQQAFDLRRKYPDLPLYTLPDNMVKIPAAWLIEQCGWKGLQVGQTGNHAQQALVIVNYGQATGMEILNHALRVQASVESKFGIALESEVNIIPG
jgi:UDP-N-acetylmuramate dehydrogenase